MRTIITSTIIEFVPLICLHRKKLRGKHKSPLEFHIAHRLLHRTMPRAKEMRAPHQSSDRVSFELLSSTFISCCFCHGEDIDKLTQVFKTGISIRLFTNFISLGK